MQIATKHIVAHQTNAPTLETLEQLRTAIKKNRQITSEQQLDLSMQHLLPFDTLTDIDLACNLLVEILLAKKSICVIGDFDTDGATSTALAVSALQAFGFKKINYLVPNRFKFGYGLTPEIVYAAQIFQPDLIITVDNGIASFAGVLTAHQLGIQVLITDHHLPAKELPKAAAIVNPNQWHDPFPSKNLAGVGVVFYLMMALRKKLRTLNWFAEQKILEPNLAQFLDLVALGTIADVVPLDHNNRILIQQGLLRIRAGQCRPGISALIALGKKRQAELAASDLAFIVAPRLNAAGRMEDMSLGIECLLATDQKTAEQLAAQLNLLNHERRLVEANMQQDAYQALEKISNSSQPLPYGICLYEEHWHQGVIGIIAARVKDRFARPVIAFAKINDAELKGSCRSVYGIHIRDVLDKIATDNPNLLSKFGGHAMAAGLSLAIDQYPAFINAFNQTIEAFLDGRTLDHTIRSDGVLSSTLLQINIAEAIQQLGPYGQAFPEPIFDGVFDLIDQRIVGGKHVKFLLKPQNSEQLLDAIAFNVDENRWPNHHLHKIHIAYRLDINEFNHRKKLQLMIEHVQDL